MLQRSNPLFPANSQDRCELRRLPSSCTARPLQPLRCATGSASTGTSGNAITGNSARTRRTPTGGQRLRSIRRTTAVRCPPSAADSSSAFRARGRSRTAPRSRHPQRRDAVHDTGRRQDRSQPLEVGSSLALVYRFHGVEVRVEADRQRRCVGHMLLRRGSASMAR